MFVNADDFKWNEPSGHFGGLTKFLVNPDNTESRYFDFRVSLFPPGSGVELHAHDEAEHVYFVLEGSGRAQCGEVTGRLEAGVALFTPPRVQHSIVNTGSVNLVFVVVTSPPSDISREAS